MYTIIYVDTTGFPIALSLYCEKNPPSR